MITVDLPASRYGTVNSPLPLVAVTCETLISSCTISTFALGTTALWGSVTTPVITPELICAGAIFGTNPARAHIATKIRAVIGLLSPDLARLLFSFAIDYTSGKMLARVMTWRGH